jgi:threonine/homoserine/homoserine lactone efflux protein
MTFLALRKGFTFGALLQIAIGPLCLLVFRTSAARGFAAALPLVFAVAMVDALYIFLSCLGAAALLSGDRMKKAVKLLGCAILSAFGANMLADVFGYSLLPRISIFSGASGANLFVQGFLLTASNPLTIVFWSGVFSAQIAENHWDRAGLAAFSAGCVLSTLVFMSLTALLGRLCAGFLPPAAIRILNALVGAALIYYGIRLLMKK